MHGLHAEEGHTRSSSLPPETAERREVRISCWALSSLPASSPSSWSLPPLRSGSGPKRNGSLDQRKGHHPAFGRQRRWPDDNRPSSSPGNRLRLELLDHRVAPWLATGGITRIKVWDERGRVVYSDVESLVGQEFEQEEWARLLLEGGPATATLESQTGEENEFEADSGELVEVYVRSASQSGAPMIFEKCTSGEGVRRASAGCGDDTAHVAVLGSPAAGATHSGRPPGTEDPSPSGGTQRVAALRNRGIGPGAPANCRRTPRRGHPRLVRTGLCFGIGRAPGPTCPTAPIQECPDQSQKNIRTLRAMIGELFRPTSKHSGWRIPHEARSALVERGIALTVEIPDKVVLDRDRAVLLPRGQEALVNATKHSSGNQWES